MHENKNSKNKYLQTSQQQRQLQQQPIAIEQTRAPISIIFSEMKITKTKSQETRKSIVYYFFRERLCASFCRASL